MLCDYDNDKKWRMVCCWLHVYLQPLLCVGGVMMSAVAIFVLTARILATRHTHNYSQAIYLLCMSLCDAFYLSLNIFVIILPAAKSHSAEMFKAPGIKSFVESLHQAVPYLYPIVSIIDFTSVGVLTAITSQRWNFTTRLRSRQLRRNQSTMVYERPLLTLLAIFTVSICMNLIKFWEYTPRELPHQPGQYTLALTDFAKDDMYKLLMNKVVYTLVLYALPLVVLLPMNLMCLSLDMRYGVSSIALEEVMELSGNKNSTTRSSSQLKPRSG